jgi:aldose 1-epimerase
LLNSFHIPTKKKLINIIDGFETAEEAAANTTNGFKSAKLNPFVCRLKNGEYNFNNKKYTIEKFYLEPHAIHGIIFDAPFTIIDSSATEESATVVLQYNYLGTDKGYPFNYTTTVTWKLEANCSLTVSTTVNHNNNDAIPFADGWHPYFTLGETIDDCILQLDSREQLEFDETLLPTKFIVRDERFVHGSLLKNISLDNCFQLTNPGKSVCTLKNNDLQLTIVPDASYPFLQVYTPSHRKSIAIENLSAAPNAFNNNWGLVFLEPNKEYHFTTKYSARSLHD